MFNPPLVWPKMQIQNSVSKGALKITTEIERDITNDPGMRSGSNSKPAFTKLDPVSRVTGIPGWYWILGIKCSDTTGVGLVY